MVLQIVLENNQESAKMIFSSILYSSSTCLVEKV